MSLNWKNRSLSIKFIISIMGVLSILGIAVLVLSITYFSKKTLSETTILFKNMIGSYAENVETVFEDSMQDGQFLAQEITTWYTQTDIAQWNEYFSEKYYVDANHAVRTKYREHDTYGVFVSNIGEFSDRVKRLIMATEGKIQVHQQAAGLRFLDTYLVMPEQMVLIDDKDWPIQIPADFNFLEQEWFNQVIPQNNPKRKSVWSSIYYDPLLQYWMTSNANPIYIDNEFLGSVGHDVVLNGLLQRISKNQDSVPQSQHILIASNGNVIYHPAYKELMEESPDTFDYKGHQDMDLLNAIGEHQHEDEKVSSAVITLEQTRYLLTFVHMPSVDWYYVQLVPYQAILEEVSSLTRWLIIASIGVFIVISLVIYGLTYRVITTPLNKGVDVANKLSQGELSLTLDISTHDEVGRLLMTMQQMAEQLKETVSRVKEASDNVTSGSESMSARAAAMSEGVTEQAAAAEEASSSMEEMVANIRQNSDNALQTEKIASQAAIDAQQSGRAVAEAVKAMQDIMQKITLIEDITRQTRMLSLNATIEAVRAQEHGKGFAVVAAEVRALAERSQQAATEINQLASSSVAIAENAGSMLSQLVPAIQKTAELVQEISAASREQNTGAAQINRAIQQLDQVTQQNSVASEELAATAEQLASQAQHLQNAMAFFSVDNMAREPEKANRSSAHFPTKEDQEEDRGTPLDDEFERY